MRIIGGRVGGRTLKTPKGSNTRPTSDKVRGAIFNILAARSDPPARVLDLYAGSGALGLEAVSRGAETALFIDVDGDACDLIRANADALGLAAEVKCSPVVRWINKEAGGTYGWIFLDPPYSSHETGEMGKALELIAKKGLLDPEGFLVAEHEWRNAPEDRYGPLALLDRRRYGQTAVSLYRLEETNG
ncbi:MAG: SAM-dependent methyltransferase [Myxococcales bacterium]|nr:SAM-dependent methyltransferase [Myxococcales bacterium]